MHKSTWFFKDLDYTGQIKQNPEFFDIRTMAFYFFGTIKWMQVISYCLALKNV